MLKSLISYILAVVLSVLYMYFLDEESGLIITAMLLTAPVISFVLTMINAKTTKIYRSVSCDIINNGEYIDFTIIAKRKFALPSPMLDIKINKPYNFSSLTKIIRFSPDFSTSSTHSTRFYSVFSTRGDFYIEEAYFSDFLGIFRFKADFDAEICAVAVVPKITQLSHDNAILTSFSENISYDDELDTTTDAMSVNTTPGYEHRDYIHGDPLKRINWKLSSKLGKLMVRLDEYISASKPIFVIDLNGYVKEDEIICADEFFPKASKFIENVLGTLQLFVTQQIECKVFVSSLSTTFECTTPEDIQKLAIEISKISLLQNLRISNMEMEDIFAGLDDKTNIVYCTFAGLTDANVLLQHFKTAQCNAAVITAYANNENYCGIPTYYYDQNNTLREFKGK